MTGFDEVYKEDCRFTLTPTREWNSIDWRPIEIRLNEILLVFGSSSVGSDSILCSGDRDEWRCDL